MSVFLNVESVPSRVRGLYRYLLAQKKCCAPYDTVIASLAPNSLGETHTPLRKDAIKKTINECLEMALIVQIKDSLAVNSDLPQPERDPATGDGMLPGCLARQIMAPDNENNPNEDFGRSLAWLLTLDPYGPPVTWNVAEQKLRESEGASLGFQDARFGNLRHWSVFLGYARTDFDGRSRGLIPDPTIAVRRSLLRHIAPGEKTPIVELLEQLAVSDPVLDGGKYRIEVDSWATPESSDTKVSKSLSLALKRLQDDGFIDLKYGADARNRTLQFNNTTEQYTTIIRTDGGER